MTERTPAEHMAAAAAANTEQTRLMALAADAAAAVEALEQADRIFRVFTGARKAADLLRSYTVSCLELSVAITKKRAVLAELHKQTVEDAVAEGKAIAAALLAEAETQKREIVASAQAEADKWADIVKQRRADLGNLQDEVSKIKNHAAALAAPASA